MYVGDILVRLGYSVAMTEKHLENWTGGSIKNAAVLKRPPDDLKMMGKTEFYHFMYENTYRLESHPKLSLTSRLSQSDTPFYTKN